MKRAADEIEREEAQMTKRTSTRAWTKSAEEVERYDGVVRERERASSVARSFQSK